ncbi:MAG: biotin--[acetyl-CoA-carboxylase] ligase [Bacteriovoracaceae bacterium]
MQYIFLPQCGSTQDEIKKLIKSQGPILVATASQTQGVGRRGHQWEFFENSLAFSFTLTPELPITLNPLMIGVSICHFFKQEFNKELKLKWPNDIMTVNGDKCGGIICELFNSNTIVAGVGLNFSSNPYGHIEEVHLTKEFQQETPQRFYQFLLSNLISDEKQCISDWQNLCFHLGQKVKICDEKNELEGVFQGIGEHGQALISQNEKIHQVFTGSLFIL